MATVANMTLSTMCCTSIAGQKAECGQAIKLNGGVFNRRLGAWAPGVQRIFEAAEHS